MTVTLWVIHLVRTNISHSQIRTPTAVHQEMRNVSFSENSVYVLNE